MDFQYGAAAGVLDHWRVAHFHHAIDDSDVDLRQEGPIHDSAGAVFQGDAGTLVGSRDDASHATRRDATSIIDGLFLRVGPCLEVVDLLLKLSQHTRRFVLAPTHVQ